MSTTPDAPLADRELASALHALSAPMLQGRVECHVDAATRSINFAALLDQPWSTSERAMIEVACSLWGRPDVADARLSSVVHSMDDGNFARVVEAMLIRRGGCVARGSLAAQARS